MEIQDKSPKRMKYFCLMKSIVTLILLVFGLSSYSSGKYNEDETLRILESIRKSPIDTSRVRHLYDLGFDIRESNPELAIQLLNEAVDISKKLKNNYALANSYRLLGLFYSNSNEKRKALECQTASLSAAKNGNHLFLEAGAYFNIGNLKYWKGEYDSCIDYYLKAQALFENPKIFEDKTLTVKILDKKTSDLYFNISSVFNTLKNLPKADEYIDKAIAIAEKHKNKVVIAFYTQQKADNYAENGKIEKALRTRLKYLPELEYSEVAKMHIQGYYQNISHEYFELGKIDSSKLYALKSLETSTQLNIVDGIAGANWQLGRIAMQEKRYDIAGNYFYKSRDYLLGSDDPTDKRSFCEVMHEYYYAIGNYKEAYNMLAKYSSLNDTILSGERTLQFSERVARYESEKKDSQIKLQDAAIQKKNLLNTLLAGGITALLIIGILFLRNFRIKQAINKQKIAELEKEKQLAAAEAVLKGEEQERTRLAGELHDGLGGLLSGIKHSLNSIKDEFKLADIHKGKFERSLDMLDTSIKEMRRVAHNLMPDSLNKFGLTAAIEDYCSFVNQSDTVKIIFQFIGDKTIQPSKQLSLTVYRIVQELVNNIVKHSGATKAIVQLSVTLQMLSITVEDDGHGFDEHLIVNAKGIGLSNIKNRVEYMNGSIDLNSGKGRGTSVVIEFKNQLV